MRGKNQLHVWPDQDINSRLLIKYPFQRPACDLPWLTRLFCKRLWINLKGYVSAFLFLNIVVCAPSKTGINGPSGSWKGWSPASACEGWNSMHDEESCGLGQMEEQHPGLVCARAGCRFLRKTKGFRQFHRSACWVGVFKAKGWLHNSAQ